MAVAGDSETGMKSVYPCTGTDRPATAQSGFIGDTTAAMPDTDPIFRSEEELARLSASERIRYRLVHAKARYHANDNIAEHVRPGELTGEDLGADRRRERADAGRDGVSELLAPE